MEFKEEQCRKCGICCHYKFKFLGIIYIDMSKACEFLDMETSKCKVYDTRFTSKPECLKLKEAIELEVMPKECSYVQEYIEAGNEYKSPKLLKSLKEDENGRSI